MRKLSEKKIRRQGKRTKTKDSVKIWKQNWKGIKKTGKKSRSQRAVGENRETK